MLSILLIRHRMPWLKYFAQLSGHKTAFVWYSIIEQEEYQNGAIPRQILEKYGYPADVLGKERIWGIAHVIKKQYHSPEGIHEGALTRTGKSSDKDAQTTEERVNKLQGEVEYLRQQIEFLKKISSIKTTRK